MTCAGTSESKAREGLQVVTWNCFGMGQSVLDAITAVRAPSRARLRHDEVRGVCEAPDILCVQELLSHDAQAFFDRLDQSVFRTKVRDHNRPQLLPVSLRGTGLGLASRAVVQGTRLRPYARRQVGWDKLARKGVLHGQVELAAGLVVDVLTTHLQSGYRDSEIEVRAHQLIELAQIVGELGAPERPFIVCGDFNVNGLAAARSGDEYRRLRAALPDFEDLGAEADLTTFDPHPDINPLAHACEPDTAPQRLDYVFFRPAQVHGRAQLRATSVERIFDRPLAATDRAFASDHFGLRAAFTLV